MGFVLRLNCLHSSVNSTSCFWAIPSDIFSALFTLHEYIISHSGEIVELDFLHKSSKAAINTLAKMVVDVARSFNERTPGLDIEILPPRASNFVRAACYLLSTSDDVDSKECCADINEIQTMLRYLSQRWKLAGKYSLQTEIYLISYLLLSL